MLLIERNLINASEKKNCSSAYYCLLHHDYQLHVFNFSRWICSKPCCVCCAFKAPKRFHLHFFFLFFSSQTKESKSELKSATSSCRYANILLSSFSLFLYYTLHSPSDELIHNKFLSFMNFPNKEFTLRLREHFQGFLFLIRYIFFGFGRTHLKKFWGWVMFHWTMKFRCHY